MDKLNVDTNTLGPWWEHPVTARQVGDELEVGQRAAWQWSTGDHGIRWAHPDLSTNLRNQPLLAPCTDGGKAAREDFDRATGDRRVD